MLQLIHSQGYNLFVASKILSDFARSIRTTSVMFYTAITSC